MAGWFLGMGRKAFLCPPYLANTPPCKPCNSTSGEVYSRISTPGITVRAGEVSPCTACLPLTDSSELLWMEGSSGDQLVQPFLTKSGQIRASCPRPYPWVLNTSKDEDSTVLMTSSYRITESWNGLGWQEPSEVIQSKLLQWAGTSSTRPGSSEPSPTPPGVFPGMGHPRPLWAACYSVSLLSSWKNSSF